MTAFSVNAVEGFAGSSVVTVTILCCVPVRLPMFRVAVISPFSPGATSFDFKVATVHPHDVWTEAM